MTTDSGREAAIKGLRQYQKELLNQLREVERSIATIAGTPEDSKRENTGLTPVRSDTGDVGPQRLVETYLRNHPGRFFKPQDIAKDAKRSGYQPRSPKHWVTQVRNCLRSAVGKGIAEVREDGAGKKKYGLKQQAEAGRTENVKQGVMP